MADVGKEGPPLTHAENQEFLGLLRDAKRWMGCETPEKVEIVFDGVSVDAEVRLGRRAPPTLRNAALNGAQGLIESVHLCTAKKRTAKIINGASGVIRPSRMTLVLGAPGSGKTTFLRALAGKLDPSLKLQGKVMYNGETSSSTSHYLCAYVSQHDLHHAEMTVRETINFSSNMLGANDEFEMLGDAIQRNMGTTSKVYQELFSKATKLGDGSNLKTNYVIKILGLSDCADTIVGDELRRGISGGQKKRTTIGEMLVGRARCFFMDDISTGLDSSTTLEITTFLQQMAHLMDLTMVISLLQPAPETFELFDDIILLCEGQIVYHGPRQNVIGFFSNMGFRCPRRKNVADFLQEVTSKMDQKQYWSSHKREYRYHSNEKFAKCFQAYNLPQLLGDNHCNKNEMKQDKKAFQADDSHIISKWNILKACILREMLLLKRNSPVHIFKAIQITFLAFVLATLFFRTEMNHDTVFDGNKYMGALFMSIAAVNFNGMTELTMTVKKLPIFYKQRELLALPGCATLCSIFLISIPQSLMETGLWTCSTYYAIGYAPSPIRFFQQFLVLFEMHQMSMSLYRLLASIGRTQVMANMLGTEALIAIFILGGFIISKDDLQPWLRWGCWASPFTYSLNAVALNEFLDDRWATVFHYANANTTGEAILKIRGLVNEWHWYWVCVGVLFGFSLMFNILSIFSLEFLNSPQEHQANINPQKVQSIEYNNQIVGGRKASTDQAKLPFQPLSLVFNQINYFVDMPKEMRKHGVTEKRLRLLQDVSGAFRPGVLTALMGITGAGKTTLLDVLAGRKTGGYIEGTINIAGYQKKQETFSRISGYCEQTDIHSPYLTVHESLQFSAYLRLPSHVSPRQRDMFVDEIMGLVELTGLRSAMVGTAGVTGLSAEQRKRLTIAVELVASPSIIFMDEPTTGLDARAAAIVMRTVRKTVNTGRTACFLRNSKEEQDVFNILGIAYGSALFLGLVNCSTLQPVLAMEKVVFYRERASGMYSSMAYVVAQIAVEIPYMLIQVFVFSAIVYPMVGFQLTVTKFFWFVLYMILSFTDYTLYGMMAVALTPNAEIAAGLSFLIFMVWNVFSGFILSRKMMPVWWRWMYWADPAAWTVYGLVFSQLGDRMELISVPGQPDQPVREFLEECLGLQDDYFPLVTALHIALSALFSIVFWISIKYLKFQRR